MTPSILWRYVVVEAGVTGAGAGGGEIGGGRSREKF